jgi:hypothetical protein
MNPQIQLLPDEELAFNVARAQVRRGETPGPNVSLMCVLTLMRLLNEENE